MEQIAKNRVRPIEGLAHPYAQKSGVHPNWIGRLTIRRLSGDRSHLPSGALVFTRRASEYPGIVSAKVRRAFVAYIARDGGDGAFDVL